MKAVFLDRDGVINRYPGDRFYVTAWKRFKFLPKVKEALLKLNRAKFKIFIVSNQAGLGKGVFSRAKLELITRNMLKAITRAGGRIDKVYYCIHRSDENCACRKPKAGMLHLAKKEHPEINLKKSFFIGDTIYDVMAARATGCKSILVLSGKEKLSNRRNWEAMPDYVFKSLWEAAEFICASS